MEVTSCGKCRQQIIRYPHESGWNHQSFDPDKPIDWKLTDEADCYTKAEPVEEVKQ